MKIFIHSCFSSLHTMQDHIGILTCFTSGDGQSDHLPVVTRLGHRVRSSVYRTKVADKCRLITITWSKNMFLNGLSVSVEGEGETQFACRIDLKPWQFLRRQGSKRLFVDCNAVDVFWDLRTAKFDGEVEPISEFYVAVVSDDEVVLLLGDRKKDAYRKTGCRPALIDPTLISKKEHLFGKTKFSTSSKFDENGASHEISVITKKSPNGVKPEMEIRIDGHPAIHVKHLQWKFRGKEIINFEKLRLEVYWDVYDWLFTSGLRPALFIFKPSPHPPQSPSVGTESSGIGEGCSGRGSSEYRLLLYAWTDEREEYTSHEIPLLSP